MINLRKLAILLLITVFLSANILDAYYGLFASMFIMPLFYSLFAILIVLLSRSIIIALLFLSLRILIVFKNNLLITQLHNVYIEVLFFNTILVYGVLSSSMKKDPLPRVIVRFADSFRQTLSSGARLSNALSREALLFLVIGIYLCISAILKSHYLKQDYVIGVIINTIPMSLMIFCSKSMIDLLLAMIVIIASWHSLPIMPLFLMYFFGEKPSYKQEPKGITIGFSKAVLVYDKPKEVFHEINQDPIIGKKRGKTWYWKRYEGPITIDYDKLPNRHIVIFGSSGMGKSSLAKIIVSQAFKKHNISFIILDHHNEYIDLVEELGKDLLILDAVKASINPFELSKNISPRHRSIELADIIQSLFNLGYIQRQILEELFLEAYSRKGIIENDPSTWTREPPSFRDIVKLIDEISKEDQRFERIKPYIQLLMQDIFTETRLSINDVLSKPTIILLASLPSHHARALYVDTFLNKLMNVMYLSKKLPRELLVVIDEAHLLFKRNRSRSIVSRLFMESRKYGVGIIAITQQPLDVSEAIILNSYVKAVFNITEYRNLDYISRTLAGYAEYSRIQAIKLAVSSIPRFNAVVSLGNNLYMVNIKKTF